MREKILSIELLKFLAIFLILNGHMGDMWPASLQMFATGGTIGDALFFFCSGYTLFLGRLDRFDNWYARRIRRIYPSIIGWSIVSLVLFNKHYDIADIFLWGTNRWFISCIMIYYVLLYVVRKYCMNYTWLVLALSVVIPLSYYCTLDSSNFFMYKGGYFRWFYWFTFMLAGAFVGCGKWRIKRLKWQYEVIITASFIILHYAISILATKYILMSHLQVLTLIPLMVAVLYMFILCDKITNVLKKERIVKFTQAISGLCLEVYLVQYSFFNTDWNEWFPLNVIVIIVIILFVAYITRTIGRLFGQVFSGLDNIDWKSITKFV